MEVEVINNRAASEPAYFLLMYEGEKGGGSRGRGRVGDGEWKEKY